MSRMGHFLAAVIVGLLLPLATPTFAQDVPRASQTITQFRGSPLRAGAFNSSALRDAPMPLWQFEMPRPVRMTPAISQGVVFIGGEDRRLHALDAATGELRWRFDAGSSVVSSPAVAEGIVYLGSLDNNFAMDGTLAHFTYTAQTPAFTLQWSVNIGGPAYSSPSYSDGVVYVVTEAGGLLYAFDAMTGEALWRYVTGTQGDWRASSPVLLDGVLYIASNTQGMLALTNR